MREDTTSGTLKQQVLESKEALRQVRDAFDERKRQDRLWFFIRYAMTWTALVLIIALMIFCMYVVLQYDRFPGNIVKVALSTLVVDLLGLFAFTWRFVFQQQSSSNLEPLVKLLTRPVEIRSANKDQEKDQEDEQ